MLVFKSNLWIWISNCLMWFLPSKTSIVNDFVKIERFIEWIDSDELLLAELSRLYFYWIFNKSCYVWTSGFSTSCRYTWILGIWWSSTSCRVYSSVLVVTWDFAMLTLSYSCSRCMVQLSHCSALHWVIAAYYY